MKTTIGRTSQPKSTPIVAMSFLVLGISSLGCSTLGERGKQLVPTNHQFHTRPFVVLSDFEVKPDSPAALCLKSLETDAEQALSFETKPAGPPIEIYILNDRDSFSHFLKFYYPELPARRAFFLAQGESRVVYTFLSPKLEEDLRHEATHALLNLRFGDLPLWLDEGLAEYFEVGSPADAGSHEHLDKLPTQLAGMWKPDLARLEALTDIRQMTPSDYREAWAWVYLLLNQQGKGKSILLNYLATKAPDRQKEKLSARLAAGGSAVTSEALVAYMTSVRNRPVAGAPASKERVLRFQDRPEEAASSSAPIVERQSPPPRGVKGFFRRVGSIFGL